MKSKLLPPLRPEWYYSEAVISNLDKITEELLFLQRTSADKLFASNHLEFFNVRWEHATKYLPTLNKLFENCGVIHKIDRILFSNKSPDLTPQCKIHVDSYIPSGTPFALNFPLFECEDSYLAFYKLKNEDTLVRNASDYKGADSAGDNINYATAEPEEVDEVARFKMIKPVLVNTTILHTGLKRNNDRIIASIRFKSYDLPTIEQLKMIGVIDPFIQCELDTSIIGVMIC